MNAPARPPSRLMLVLPLPVYKTPDGLRIESQACNGLRLWLENFEAVDLFCPLFETEPPLVTMAVDDIVHAERLTIVPLPQTFSPIGFARHLPKVAAIIRKHLPKADYLHFAIGGIWGDWGSLAAFLASRQGRRYAVWTDQVASKTARFVAGGKSGIRKLYWQATAAILQRYERRVICNAAVGMFHGADCYNSFAGYSSSPHLVHNIHLPPEAAITKDEIEAKLARLGQRLRIVYAGRTHAEKGIADWIGTLAKVAAAGVDFEAAWYGDGPALDEARAAAAAAGLEARVRFPGSLDDHRELMRRVGEADLLLFCHKIAESPRCLIEALIAGTPIVGYRSPFPEDLIKENGGGVLTPLHDTDRLAAEVAALTVERRADLIQRAAADGAPFNDEATFRHRSDLMKTIPNKPG